MRLLVIAVALGILFSGCARTPEAGSLGVAAYCDVARPIFWSAKDTRDTKEQVDSENAKWKLLCKKETGK